MSSILIKLTISIINMFDYFVETFKFCGQNYIEKTISKKLSWISSCSEGFNILRNNFLSNGNCDRGFFVEDRGGLLINTCYDFIDLIENPF